jgi:hypothetical protein
VLFLRLQSGGDEEPSREKVLRLIQDPFGDAKSLKNLASVSSAIDTNADRRFEFQKCRQPFIRTHDVTLPVVPMSVCNPDRSSVGINC